MEKKKIIHHCIAGLLFVVVAMLGVGVHTAEASIGMSPVEHFYNILLPNQQVTATAYFTRKDASQDERVRISADGEGAEAIQFLDGEEIVLPALQNKTAYTFGVNATDLPQGTYEPRLHVSEIAPDSDDELGGSGVTTLSGAKAIVHFTVVNDEISECSIDNAVLEETEEGQPLLLRYRVNNTGNVKVRPEQIELTLRGKFDANNFERITVSGESIPFSEPFQDQFQEIEIPHTRQASEYSARVIFFGCQEKVDFVKTQDITIYEEGTFDQSGEFFEFDTDKEEYLENEIVNINGKFRNTGQIAYGGRLIIEIETDGKRIEVIESEAKRILPGSEVEFNEIFRPSNPGEYNATGYVEFGSQISDKIDAPFVVVPANSIVLGLFIAGLAILLGLLIFLIYKKRRKDLEILKVSFVDIAAGKPLKLTYLIKNHSSKEQKLGKIQVSLQEPKTGEVLWEEHVLSEVLQKIPGKKEVISELVSDNNIPQDQFRVVVSFFNEKKEYIFVEDEIFVKEITPESTGQEQGVADTHQDKKL